MIATTQDHAPPRVVDSAPRDRPPQPPARLNKPLLQAAAHYRTKAEAARRRGVDPLEHPPTRAAAARLLRTAAAWHRDWLEWRTELGQPPSAATPIEPPKTSLGAIIQAAKQFGNSAVAAQHANTLVAAVESWKPKRRQEAAP